MSIPDLPPRLPHNDELEPLERGSAWRPATDTRWHDRGVEAGHLIARLALVAFVVAFLTVALALAWGSP